MTRSARNPWMLALAGVLSSGLLYCCGKTVYERVVTPQGPATPNRDHGPVSRVPVGMGLADVTWSAGFTPYVDIMHQADPWWSASESDWRDERPLPKDEHGWPLRLMPGQIARTFVMGGDNPHHPSGTYVVTWEGSGQLEFRGGVRGDVVRSEGRAEVPVRAPDGLWLEIHAIDAADPIRNIQVFVPGGRCAQDPKRYCEADDACGGRCVPFEETVAEHPFHPEFLAELAPFGVIRFMDWQRTNRSRGGETPPWWPIRDWDGVPSPDDAIWVPAPLEVMVDLANAAGADPWFNVPHLATDEYVRRLAEYTRDELDPRLRVYVEYTNEYWNDLFEQHQVINGLGCARWSEDAAGDCDPDGNGVLCEYTEWNATQERCLGYGERYFAVRSAEIGAIFDEVFGEARAERVVRVLGMQIGAVPTRGASMLRQRWRGDEPVHRQMDAVGVAPYFGGDAGHVQEVDDAFRRVTEETHGAPVGTFELLSGAPDADYGGPYKWIADDVRALQTEADFAHLRLVAYEGGQHLVAHEPGARHELFEAINRDPRMGELYDQYLRVWAELTGGGTFVHYASPSAWSHFGYWGSKEYQGQPRSDAPKHDALLRFAERARAEAAPEPSR